MKRTRPSPESEDADDSDKSSAAPEKNSKIVIAPSTKSSQNQTAAFPNNAAPNTLLYQPLETSDPQVYALIEREGVRQKQWLNLVASENYSSVAVQQTEGSIMMNKYSEGYPGHRHYGGNDIVDQMEQLCQARALELFGLDSEEWGANVQSVSGTQANYQVFHALMKPHDRLMGLSVTHGGHMSFGYQTDNLKVSAVSAVFDTLPYRTDPRTGQVDYVDLEQLAARFRPRVIIAGASSYSRHLDYARLKRICTECGAFLVVDIAHCAGQLSAGLMNSPFPYADVVTMATQKTLRGPRAATIIYRRPLESRINFAVFPALQGGPHNHTITALAVALKQANTQEFKEYQRQLLANSQKLAFALMARGYTIISGGTDTHMVVLSLVGLGTDGSRVSAAAERAHVTMSATTVPGDKWSLPRAVRLGAAPMTSRGFVEADFDRVADLIDRIIQLSQRVQAALPEDANKLRDFKVATSARPEFEDLAREVTAWVGDLPLPIANS